jgi:hypothetical protein
VVFPHGFAITLTEAPAFFTVLRTHRALPARALSPLSSAQGKMPVNAVNTGEKCAQSGYFFFGLASGAWDGCGLGALVLGGRPELARPVVYAP